MDSISKLQEISLRLDHLEASGDWLARTLVHVDAAASHTGSLVTVLVDDIRQRILELVTELETEIAMAARSQQHHCNSSITPGKILFNHRGHGGTQRGKH